MGSFEDAVIAKIDSAKGGKPYFKSVVKYMEQQVRNEENARNKDDRAKGANVTKRDRNDAR